MRASDREREATVLRLRAAHLEGRIAVEELEQRVGVAQAARTREELDAVEADLPARAAATVDLTSGIPRMPGRRHFNERKLLNSPLDDVREAALAHVVPSLERHGFFVTQETHDSLTFVNDWRRSQARLMLRFRDAGDHRTLVLAHGVAPLAVRRAFARLSD